MNATVSIIGGRGYTGRELLHLLNRHPGWQVAAVASRSQAGQPITTLIEDFKQADLTFCDATPEAVFAQAADAYVLALPNGEAAYWVAEIDKRQPDAIIVDLSADYRVDSSWVYGLPEINRLAIRGARRIANPGCYATAAALTLWPYRTALAEDPVVFGISGFSGAGSTPNPRNDPARLHNNILPYQLVEHAHQRELGRVIGRDVSLMPHVADFFRGLVVTSSMRLSQPLEDASVWLKKAYVNEPLIQLSDAPAEPAQVAGHSQAVLGPAVVDPRDPRRIVLTAALDNLAKGAATQALQNLNLCQGYAELEGIPRD